MKDNVLIMKKMKMLAFMATMVMAFSLTACSTDVENDKPVTDVIFAEKIEIKVTDKDAVIEYIITPEDTSHSEKADYKEDISYKVKLVESTKPAPDPTPFPTPPPVTCPDCGSTAHVQHTVMGDNFLMVVIMVLIAKSLIYFFRN